MAEKLLAKITQDGHVALPAEFLEVWNLRPGDMIAFDPPGAERASIEPRRRRSILETLEDLKLPQLGRPFSQADIENAITEAVTAKELRSRGT
jgi:bifunctional DNA-binding transcriptional regulator/antitoxin component of YhaV-PrlF toxin-antitoxin module